MANELVVVTATANLTALGVFLRTVSPQTPVVAVVQRGEGTGSVTAFHGIYDAHPDYLGVVPAFARGCELALHAYPEARVIACLHDDTLVQDPWEQDVLDYFESHPRCGLLGFGGAAQLGENDIHTTPYSPFTLVRKRFMSNMVDAESHGIRVTTAREIACLDGFSQIFRRSALEGETGAIGFQEYTSSPTLFHELVNWGVRHHAYDAATGAFMARLGWETHLLPIRCVHLGGQTAVGDGRYTDWARAQTPNGDQDFWEQAHQLVYQHLKDELPIIVPQPEDR